MDRETGWKWPLPHEWEEDPYSIGYGRWLIFLEFFWKMKYIVVPLLVIFELFEQEFIYFDKFIEWLGKKWIKKI